MVEVNDAVEKIFVEPDAERNHQYFVIIMVKTSVR